MTNLNAISKHVRKAIEATGHFEILSKDQGVPLVAFRLNKVKGADGKLHARLYDEFQLAERMRMFGWVLPAYKMPEGAEHVKLMRITIREDFSMTMADQVIAKLIECVEWLDNHFTVSKDDLDKIAKKTWGRTFSRMDSNVLVDFTELLKCVLPSTSACTASLSLAFLARPPGRAKLYDCQFGSRIEGLNCATERDRRLQAF